MVHKVLTWYFHDTRFFLSFYIWSWLIRKKVYIFILHDTTRIWLVVESWTYKKKTKLDKFHFIFINQIIYSIPYFNQQINFSFTSYMSVLHFSLRYLTSVSDRRSSPEYYYIDEADNLFSISHIFLLFYSFVSSFTPSL